MLGIFPSIWRRWPYPPQIRKKKKITFFLVVVVSAPHCADAMRRGGGRPPYCLVHSLCVYVTSLAPYSARRGKSLETTTTSATKKSNKSISAIPSHFFFGWKVRNSFNVQKKKRGPRSVWVGAIALHAIETRSCHRRQHNNLFNNFIHAKLYKRLVVFLPVAKRFAPSRSQKK